MSDGRVLIVDDEEGIRDILSRVVRREGFEALAVADGESALDLLGRESLDALLLDLRLPGLDGMEVLRRAKALDRDLPVIMITGHGGAKNAVEALKAGAHDYLVKPFEHADVVRAVQQAVADRGLRRTIRILTDKVREGAALYDLMGPSDQVARISEAVARVASSDFAVMITGETGAGKELVARAIHQLSRAANGPLVAVDCGAIPETLFESELFGHEKGAFTGAVRQAAGRFEAASGGTLFLDEISNLPLGCQAKLLRVLQDRHVTRVGGTQPVRVDVRVVAASNKDLETMVEAGRFRRDLFFRLNEFAIAIPPLRARKQDIVYLAKRFLDLTNGELRKTVKGFTAAAVECLLRHPWPGNVRELRSAVRRAVLMADEVIDVQHLELWSVPPPAVGPPATAVVSNGQVPLKELVRRVTASVERAALVDVLRKTGGNKAKAARLLQIDYKTIHLKLREYGIATPAEALEGAGADKEGDRDHGQA